MFSQFVGRFFGQIFDQGFDQGLGEGKNHKYSAQHYPALRKNVLKHQKQLFLPLKITPLQWDPKQQELKTQLRPRLVLGPYGGLVWSRTLKTWKKNIGFIVVSLKNSEKAMVLLCFRSKVLKKQWFYYVFAQRLWKRTGFIVFSLKHVEKALVLPCFRSKKLHV